MLTSSVGFGLLHTQQILPGILAGLAYVLAARRRGRLTDAILAHATTNALLTIYVLATHTWSAWG
jgi:membrane protease YdiL (CAAX protease family)